MICELKELSWSALFAKMPSPVDQSEELGWRAMSDQDRLAGTSALEHYR